STPEPPGRRPLRRPAQRCCAGPGAGPAGTGGSPGSHRSRTRPHRRLRLRGPASARVLHVQPVDLPRAPGAGDLVAALLQWAQEAPTGVDGLVRSLRELLTPEGLQAAAAALGRIAVVILSAWLLGYLLRRAGDALFGRLQGRRAFFNEARTQEARRLLRALIRLAIWLTAAAAVLETLGVDVRALLREPGLRGYVEALVIILAAHLVIRIGSLLIDQVFEHREAQAQADPRIDPQRAATLRGLLRSVLRYAVDIAAVLT